MEDIYLTAFDNSEEGEEFDNRRGKFNLFSLAVELATERKADNPKGAAKKAIAELQRLGFLTKWVDSAIFGCPMPGNCNGHEEVVWIVCDMNYRVGMMEDSPMNEMNDKDAEIRDVDPWQIILKEAERAGSLKIMGIYPLLKKNGMTSSDASIAVKRLLKKNRLIKDSRYKWRVSVGDEEIFSAFTDLPVDDRKSAAKIAKTLAKFFGSEILEAFMITAVERLIRQGRVKNVGGRRSLALYEPANSDSDKPESVAQPISLIPRVKSMSDPGNDPILAGLDKKYEEAKSELDKIARVRDEYMQAIKKAKAFIA